MSAIAGFEDEISSSCWTYNPQMVGFYRLDQRMAIYGGFGILWHSVGSEFYPVLGLAWNMDAKAGLSGALGFPETMVRYGFNEKVALKMDFQWDIRFYQLAEENNLTSKGYVKIEDLKPGLQMEYEPITGLTFPTLLYDMLWLSATPATRPR